MVKSTLCVTVEKAISQVVVDFQDNPERFWNERDLHWSLFYYLKHQRVSEEAYPTQLIRAELPTRKVFPGKKPARGHYDLAILDAESYYKPEVQNMKAQASWKEFIEVIEIAVAVEVKLWLNRLRPENMAERVDWDITKLTDKPNNVQNAYFLNFVQLNFKSDYMMRYYQELRDYLTTRKQPGLNILCIPSDPKIQSVSANWL
jgi:hypothetical protein